MIYAVCMADPGFLCLLEGAGGHREKAGGLCACPGAEVKWRACSFSSRHTGKYDIREKARQRSAPPGFFCFVSFHIFCVCFGKSCAALSHPEDKKPMVCFLAKRKKQMDTFSNCAPVLTGRKRMAEKKRRTLRHQNPPFAFGKPCKAASNRKFLVGARFSILFVKFFFSFLSPQYTRLGNAVCNQYSFFCNLSIQVM